MINIELQNFRNKEQYTLLQNSAAGCIVFPIIEGKCD